MLAIESLTVSYGPKPILKDLELTIQSNSIHGVLGKNGAGKTTLFKTIYGQIKPDKGALRWEAQSVHPKYIGFLETHNFFYNNITGREYLSLLSNNSKHSAIWEQLFQLPLDELIDRYSTGMKKKLALQGILLQNRPLLILDEPFNGVDLESSELIYSILEKLKQLGKTIIIASHILETLSSTCDRISFLENGKFQRTFEKDKFPNMEQELRNSFKERIDPLLEQILE